MFSSINAVLALIVVAVLLVGLFAIPNMMHRWRVERRLSNQSTAGNTKRSAVLMTGEILARHLCSKQQYQATSSALVAAGFWKAWHVDLYIVLKNAFIAAVFIAGLFYLSNTAMPIHKHAYNWLLWLFCLFLSLRVPQWILDELRKKRQHKIRMFIPKAVDLMTLALDCGISLEKALERVAKAIKKQAPEISREFELTQYEMLIIDRQSALVRLEKRTGVHEMEMLAVALRQSIQFGIPLADILRTIASETRRAQMAELDEKAGKISADIGVPLIVLILFPVIVIIASPAVIQLMDVF